jgi:IPT/TIG domain
VAIISPGLSYGLSALTLIVVATVISGAVKKTGDGERGISGLIMGRDNRGSTSKAQALVWTIAVSFALVSLLLRDPTKISDANLSQDYLYLLGFPAAALVGSKGVAVEKISNGTVSKTPRAKTKSSDPAATDNVSAANTTAAQRAKAQTAQDTSPWRSFTSVLGDIFADDTGNVSLHDTQLVVFTLIAVAWYLVTFFKTPTAPFPDLPDTLLVLTGVATATYVGGKLVANQKPTISDLFPRQPTAGQSVTIIGTNFAQTGGPDTFKPEVSFDSKTAKPDAVDPNRLTVTVPKGLEGAVDVTVLNTGGLTSDAKRVTILAGEDGLDKQDEQQNKQGDASSKLPGE